MEKILPTAATTDSTEQVPPAGPDLLRRPRGPIRAHHDRSRRMARRTQPLRSALWRPENANIAENSHPSENPEARSTIAEILGSRSDLLRGTRIFKYPYIALMSESLAKPWRHILSQKVIAGTMTVHPPYVAPKPTA